MRNSIWDGLILAKLEGQNLKIVKKIVLFVTRVGHFVELGCIDWLSKLPWNIKKDKNTICCSYLDMIFKKNFIYI